MCGSAAGGQQQLQMLARDARLDGAAQGFNLGSHAGRRLTVEVDAAGFAQTREAARAQFHHDGLGMREGVAGDAQRRRHRHPLDANAQGQSAHWCTLTLRVVPPVGGAHGLSICRNGRP